MEVEVSVGNANSFWEEQWSTTEAAEALDVAEQNAIKECVAFFGDITDSSLIDIGCGLGKSSIALARLGARVTSVDRSKAAVSKLNEYAAAHNLPIMAICGDALDIEKLGTFDFVVGSMILHHIEPFSLFCDVLFRTMNPHAKAFFCENSSASRLLVWMREHIVGRLWVPKYGDSEEFPLEPQEVDMLRRRFVVTQTFPEFFFFQLISKYLLKGRGAKTLKVVDDFCYRRNLLVKLSYIQHLLIEKA